MNFSGLASSFFSVIRTIGVSDIIDVAIITFVIFYVLRLLKKTKAIRLLRGVVLIFVGYIIATQFQLKTVSFLIESLLQVGLIALLVVFQPELRRALEQVGSANIPALNFFRKRTAEEIEVDRLHKAIAAICDGIERMSEKQTGALIVMENFSNLEAIKSTGTYVNADITPELIGTIFYDGSPLHDGAVIIHNGRIISAGCVLPLSDNFEISKEMGTRHRAALGLSEVSDAIALVVSEETGTISYAKNGVLTRHQNRQSIYNMLNKEFVQPILDAADSSSTNRFLRRKDN
ncbi:MAG: diadenylate cyclase CdaA [Oscillospiraceae bacterium]|nr:diadenylate cyclase CdaA [Oscillospiraceae bacterium]